MIKYTESYGIWYVWGIYTMSNTGRHTQRPFFRVLNARKQRYRPYPFPIESVSIAQDYTLMTNEYLQCPHTSKSRRLAYPVGAARTEQ
jgi:hypothetical protein